MVTTEDLHESHSRAEAQLRAKLGGWCGRRGVGPTGVARGEQGKATLLTQPGRERDLSEELLASLRRHLGGHAFDWKNAYRCATDRSSAKVVLYMSIDVRLHLLGGLLGDCGAKQLGRHVAGLDRLTILFQCDGLHARGGLGKGGTHRGVAPPMVLEIGRHQVVESLGIIAAQKTQRRGDPTTATRSLELADPPEDEIKLR